MLGSDIHARPCVDDRACAERSDCSEKYRASQQPVISAGYTAVLVPFSPEERLLPNASCVLEYPLPASRFPMQLMPVCVYHTHPSLLESFTRSYCAYGIVLKTSE